MITRDGLSHGQSWRFAVVLFVIGALIAATPALAQQSDGGASSKAPALPSLTELFNKITGGPSKPSGPTYKRTRLVIGLEKEAEFEVFSLVKPNRVVLELPTMRMSVPAIQDNVKGSLIKNVRGGASGKGRTRIVVNVAAPVVVEHAYVAPASGGNPAQLRMDIVPAKQRSDSAQRPDFKVRSASLGGFGLQPPVPRHAANPREQREQAFKPIIVVDPGHGGYDSGAKKYGVQEKNVVLAFARMLRDKLVATGRYKVLMTRDTDQFVTLGNRRKFAERHKANLFISVHADYASSKASGATIYSLRQRVARRLKKSAKKRVARNVLSKAELSAIHKASVGSASMVKNMLADLAQREVNKTDFNTNMFSETVIKHMGKSTDMRQRPHQSAAFKVLKTATMPAVLIELAYVSNRRDARRLQSKTWRNKVSSSIARAVDNYFENADRFPM